jgi:hypothetical protein
MTINLAVIFKIAIIVALLMIVFSLFSALFYLGKDKGSGERTVRALTIRITLSILLFVLLITGNYFGLIGSNVHL